MNNVIYRLVLLALLLFGCCSPLLAQTPPSTLESLASDEPIEIVADRLEGDQQLGNAKFFGNVVAKQGDVTIYAEELSIYFQPDNRETEKIVAHTKVRIVQGERVATAEQAVYFSKEGQIVLTGSPEVHQGQDLIQGDEITFFLNEERSIVTGQKGGRVTAVFRSQGSKP